MTVSWRSLRWTVVLLGLLDGVQGCSGMPRIVVLHDPLTPAEHVTLGTAYEGQGQTELAAQEYRAALKTSPAYTPALVGLGNLAFARGALEQADAYYRQALEAAPADPGANNNLAMLCMARGESLDEAERLARRALAQGGPLQPYALDTLARIYVRQGRYREAQSALDRAEALVPPENGVFHGQLVRLRQELAGIQLRAE